MWSAVTGMKAQELSLDMIANNLSNINTTSFKGSRANFQDLLYTVLRSPGATSGEGQVPGGIQVGHGTRVAGISKTFEQGPLVQTDNPLDIAVAGDGFFEVTLPDGTLAYTRDGSFRLSSGGEVVTTDGYRVSGFDTIEAGTTEITISPDGALSTVVNGTQVSKGRLTLVRFVNPEGLRSIGKNLYKETEASGSAQTGLMPGTSGVGSLNQRYLESSNINAAEELVNMITTQRAYEATSKVIRASDEMMSMANRLTG
jgi:flagellar basal-body rod protein FlgG